MDFKIFATRLKAQKEGKDAVRQANYNACMIASVGLGKGKMMLDLAQELYDAGKIKTVLYVCDSQRLRDSDKEGFPQEIEKWVSPELKKIIRLECYQTTYKWENKEYDLLLADEFDFAVSPSYVKIFLNNKFKYKIVVSGTCSKAKEEIIKTICPIVFRYTTEDGENQQVLNKTKYYIYNYKLSDEESEEYRRLTLKVAQAMAVDADENTKRFWTLKRKHFLSRLESSQHHCKKIMKWLYDQDKKTRMVIFCEDTDQADKVCKYSFHGKNEKDDNLTKFQNGEINAMSTVKKIRRGINMRTLMAAIFEMLSGSSTEFDQRNGRLKRLPVDEVATVIFMCPWYKKKPTDNGGIFYKETVVADWINRATSNFKNITFKTLKL